MMYYLIIVASLHATPIELPMKSWRQCEVIRTEASAWWNVQRKPAACEIRF